MNKEIQKKVDVLSEIFGKHKRQNDEFLFWCPRCDHHKRKLSVNIKKNCYKCWVCGFSGFDVQSLIVQYGSREHTYRWQEVDDFVDVALFEKKFKLYLSLEDQTNAEEGVKCELPSEYKTLVKKDYTPKDRIALNYLEGRGLDRQDIYYWKIGYADEGKLEDRIIVPSFDKQGNLNYYVARTYRDEKPIYYNCSVSKNDIVFNELMINWGRDINLVEGVFDAIKAGPNSIPLLGKSLRKSSVLFDKITEYSPDVYIALDTDARKSAFHIAKKLLRYDVNVYIIDVEPFNDVGEMSYNQFKLKKSSADRIRSDNLPQMKIRYGTDG